MKYKITKAEFEALEDGVKGEYSLSGDGAVLNLEGDGAPTEALIAKLTDKHRIAEDHRKTAETKLKESDNRAEELQKALDGAGGNKDAIEKIKQTHQKELEKIRQERSDETAKIKTDRDNAMIREAAEKIAGEHFTIPGLITPQIAARLSVDDVNGTPVIRVKNEDGTPSIHSVDELKKEFVDNADFSTIIKSNVGSGGGATHIPGTGGFDTQKKISQMTALEEATFEKENPDAYSAAISAQNV